MATAARVIRPHVSLSGLIYRVVDAASIAAGLLLACQVGTPEGFDPWWAWATPLAAAAALVCTVVLPRTTPESASADATLAAESRQAAPVGSGTVDETAWKRDAPITQGTEAGNPALATSRPVLGLEGMAIAAESPPGAVAPADDASTTIARSADADGFATARRERGDARPLEVARLDQNRQDALADKAFGAPRMEETVKHAPSGDLAGGRPAATPPPVAAAARPAPAAPPAPATAPAGAATVGDPVDPEVVALLEAAKAYKDRDRTVKVAPAEPMPEAVARDAARSGQRQAGAAAKPAAHAETPLAGAPMARVTADAAQAKSAAEIHLGMAMQLAGDRDGQRHLLLALRNDGRLPAANLQRLIEFEGLDAAGAVVWRTALPFDATMVLHPGETTSLDLRLGRDLTPPAAVTALRLRHGSATGEALRLDALKPIAPGAPSP